MNVLVVAYYFPPIGGGGVSRTLKLVRGLAAAGHRPWVLTVDDAAWVHDPSLLAEVPARARVLRLANPDWGRVAASRRTARPAGAGSGPAPGRLRRWLVPDLNVGWSALAAPVAALLAATRSVDVVYTTCPPYSAHAPGAAARACGVPWVADFRDAWVDCPTRVDLPSWRRRVERALEAAVLRRADRVVFASEAARAHALARVPDLHARSETVHTGFDAGEFPDALASTPPPPRPGGRRRLELVHAGTVLVNHMGPTFDALLEALRGWIAREPEVARTLRLAFVGGEEALRPRIAARGLGDVVRVEPAVSRRALGARLVRAHACLALAAPGRFGADPVPGKTFDAAGAGRPLLVVAGEGGFAALVRRLGLGEVVAPGDAEGLVRVLDAWRRRVRAGRSLPAPPARSRRALSAETAVARLRAAIEAAGRAGRGAGRVEVPA